MKLMTIVLSLTFFGFILLFYTPLPVKAIDTCATATCPTGDADIGVNFTGLQQSDLTAGTFTVTVTGTGPVLTTTCSKDASGYCQCAYPAVGPDPAGTAGYTASCNAFYNSTTGNIECQIRHLDCRNGTFNITVSAAPTGYTCTPSPTSTSLSNCSSNSAISVSCIPPPGTISGICKVYNGNTTTSTCLASGGISGITINSGSTVTWCVSSSGGTGTYSYSWSGDDSLSGTTQSVTKAYTNSGTATVNKTASITVSSGTATPVTPSCPTVTVNPPSTPCSCSSTDNANYCAAYTNSCGASCPGQKTCLLGQKCTSSTTPNSCITDTTPACTTQVNSVTGPGSDGKYTVNAEVTTNISGITDIDWFMNDSTHTSPIGGTDETYTSTLRTLTGVNSSTSPQTLDTVVKKGTAVTDCSPDATFCAGCVAAPTGSTPTGSSCKSVNSGCSSNSECCSDICSSGKCITLSGKAGCGQPCGAPGGGDRGCASGLGGSLSLGNACGSPSGWGFLRCISDPEAQCARDNGYSANADVCWEPPRRDNEQCGGDRCACAPEFYCDALPGYEGWCQRRTPGSFSLSNFTTSCSAGQPAITLQWGASSDANSYQVLRYTSSGWVVIGTTASTSFTDPTGTNSGQPFPTPSTSYTYTIKALNSGTNTKVTYSSNQYTILAPSCPLRVDLKVRPAGSTGSFIDAPYASPLPLPANASAQLSYSTANAASCTASSSFDPNASDPSWKPSTTVSLNTSNNYVTTKSLPGASFKYEYRLTCTNPFQSLFGSVFIKTPTPLNPWIQTVGGDVHSNTRINTPGGPP